MTRLTDEEVIDRTAKLAVECGLGGRRSLKGKPLNIYHGMPAYELMLAMAEAAYEAGASIVDSTLWSPRLDALHVSHATPKALVNVPKTWSNRWNDLVKVRGSTIRVEGVDDPLALSKCDAKKVGAFNKAHREARANFYDNGLAKGITPWTIVPFATQDWGKMIFPEKSPEEARQLLQDALVEVMGLQHPDFIERWWKRGERLEKRSKLLDRSQIRWLHFWGPGTDLRIGLQKTAQFGSGLHHHEKQRYFVNMPTFENFTTPDCREVEGQVQMTMPVLINGELVDGLNVWFTNGKVSRFTAETGGAAFEAMIKADEGASFLGEVALVGIDDSPISNTGIVFRNTLLDENAACHIAFGNAYVDRLKGGTKLKKSQKAALGCNMSKVHHDCMISDKQTTVVAELRDGSKITVIENGAWAGKFAV